MFTDVFHRMKLDGLTGIQKPANFPANSVPPARVAYWVDQDAPEHMGEVVHGAYEAHWLQGRGTADIDTAQDVAEQIGIARATALAAACFLVGYGGWMPGFCLSILLIGIAAWSIPVIMAAPSGDFFGPAAAANALAVQVLVFSVGQGMGPVIAGFQAEHSGSYQQATLVPGWHRLLRLA